MMQGKPALLKFAPNKVPLPRETLDGGKWINKESSGHSHT